jgi:hypothetical protein
VLWESIPRHARERAMLSGNIYFSFGFLQRKLLHNSFLLVIIKHLCSNFRCRNPKEKYMFPDEMHPSPRGRCAPSQGRELRDCAMRPAPREGGANHTNTHTPSQQSTQRATNACSVITCGLFPKPLCTTLQTKLDRPAARSCCSYTVPTPRTRPE